MLFWIDIDGDQVAVQAVNRKPNPYWRLAPYTMVYPTPRQSMVRNTFSGGAHKAAYGTQEDVNIEVKESFKNWNYAPKPENLTYSVLKQLYGEQADEVLDYIGKQKRVAKKLHLQSVKAKVEKAMVEHVTV